MPSRAIGHFLDFESPNSRDCFSFLADSYHVHAWTAIAAWDPIFGNASRFIQTRRSAASIPEMSARSAQNTYFPLPITAVWQAMRVAKIGNPVAMYSNNLIGLLTLNFSSSGKGRTPR